MIVVVIVVIRVAVVVVVLESPYAATCEALGLETPHHASLLYDSGRRTLRPSPDPRSFRLDAVWPQRRLPSFQHPGCILSSMVSRDTDQPRAIKLRELRIIGDGLQWTRHSTAETAVELFATSVADRLPARDPVIFEYIQRPPHCCKQLTSLSQDIRTMVIPVFFSCFGCEFSASFTLTNFTSCPHFAEPSVFLQMFPTLASRDPLSAGLLETSGGYGHADWQPDSRRSSRLGSGNGTPNS